MLYRIYTERFDTRDIRHGTAERIVASAFDGFTRFDSVGYWIGVQEPSECFEIITDDNARVMEAARDIRRCNDQAAVLVVAIPCTPTLVFD